MKPSTYLEQLDDFSLMSVFDLLSLNDLLLLAQMSPRFYDIITKHYLIGKFRLHEQRIVMRVDGRFSSVFYPSEVMARDDSDRMFWVVEQYGHVFGHIYIDIYKFGDADSRKFIEHVNHYCKNAKKEIDIHKLIEGTLIEQPFSFDNNTYRVRMSSYGNEDIAWNDLFPALEHLTLGSIEKSIAQHHPHLKTIILGKNDADYTDPNVLELIRSNPQLRHFHSKTFDNVTYVQYINEMLPNLEWLSLEMKIVYENDSTVVDFKNVRKFSFNVFSSFGVPAFWSFIGNIRFDQLEEMELDIIWKVPLTEQLIRMIAVNRGLKTFKTSIPMSHVTFVQLVEALPELRVLTFDWYEGIHETLSAIFSGRYGLENVTIRYWDRGTANDYKDIIPANWQTILVMRDTYTFIRKC